jgi:hypothetical protein
MQVVYHSSVLSAEYLALFKIELLAIFYRPRSFLYFFAIQISITYSRKNHHLKRFFQNIIFVKKSRHFHHQNYLISGGDFFPHAKKSPPNRYGPSGDLSF